MNTLTECLQRQVSLAGQNISTFECELALLKWGRDFLETFTIHDLHESEEVRQRFITYVMGLEFGIKPEGYK